MCGGFGECELYVVFAARIVWLQRVASLVLVSDMSGKLEDLQTGLADKGEDWLRKELASLKLGPLIERGAHVHQPSRGAHVRMHMFMC